MCEARRQRRRVWGGLLLLLVAGVLLGVPAYAALIGATVNLRADPQRASADGSTPVAISVEVMDASGRPAPDGTPVHLVTTLGTIVSPVETLGGLAQTVLNPSNQAGTAVVSAMVGSARATVEVEFVGVAGSAAPGSRMVELTAKELSYSTEQKRFVAGPEARLEYESIVITADGMQYDVMTNLLRAQGNVVVRSGDQEVRGEALRYELSSLRGRLLRISGEQAERLLVEGERLQTRADPSKEEALWSRVPEVEVRTWLKARSATIDPRRKVILDHAGVYVDDLKVMGLRRHVLDPRSNGALFGNTFGFSTLMGANMDLPIYYRASGNQIGALHLVRNRMVGGVGGGPGWSLGLKEEYLREGKSEGTLSIQDLTDPTRGIDWRHQLKLDKGAALTLDASLAHYEDDAPTLKSGGLTYATPMSGGRLSLALSASDYGRSQHYYGSLSYRLPSTRLGSGVLMSPVVRLRQTHRFSEQQEIIVNPDTGEVLEIPKEDTGATSPGLDVAFSLPGREIAPKVQLTASLMTGYAWGLADGSRSVLDGRLGLVRWVGADDFVRFSYDYSASPAALQASPFKLARQRLSLHGRAKIREYEVTLNASSEIGGDRQFAHLGVTRPLPFGREANGQPRWRLQLSHVFTRLTDYSLSSSRASLIRKLGRYELALSYSPQGHGGYESRPYVNWGGYGYTYSGGQHLWLELSSYGF